MAHLPEDWETITSVVKTAYSESDESNIKIDYVTEFSTMLSVVLKLKVTQNGQTSLVYVKREAKETEDGILEREHANQLRFSATFELGKPAFNCVESLAYSPKDNILVLKDCPGDSFFDLIKTGCRWSATGKDHESLHCAAESCGRWLNFVENHSLVEEDTTQVFERIRHDIDVAEYRLKDMDSFSFLLKLFYFCKNFLLANLEAIPPDKNNIYLAHGDFHPGNLFIHHGTHISAIDFQHVEPQLVGYDALYLEMLLKLSFGLKHYNPWLINNMVNSFFRGYAKPFNTFPIRTQAIKAQIVIRSLVYLSSICQEKKFSSRLAAINDMTKLSKWMNVS